MAKGKEKTLEEEVFSSGYAERQKQQSEQTPRKLYEQSKQRLLKLENGNYSHILVIKTPDNWYKILAHSALMFLYYVTPIAQEKYDENYKPPKLLSDSDYHNKAPIGVLNFQNLEKIDLIMGKCGFKRAETETDNEWITAFKLDREMAKEEFWKLKKEEDELWTKVNRTITPKASYPNLGVDVQESLKLFYDVARKLHRDAKEFIGYSIFEQFRQLESMLIRTEKGYIAWSEFFPAAIKLVSLIQANVTIMSTMRLEDRKTLLRLAESIKRIEDDLHGVQKAHGKK